MDKKLYRSFVILHLPPPPPKFGLNSLMSLIQKFKVRIFVKLEFKLLLSKIVSSNCKKKEAIPVTGRRGL
jgi:hypothetical protein